MVNLLVTGGTVITMDGARRILDNGAVAIAADRIADVGDSAELAKRYPYCERIDAAGKVVMPGLIDAHAHAGHGLIKTMGMEQNDHWERICGEVYTTGSTPDFWYAEARLAALERLRFGVTCGVSLLGGGDTIMRTDDPEYAEAHCRGVSEVGTRSVVAVGSTRPPHPLTYARWENGRRVSFPVDFEQQMASCRSIVKTWHGNGRIRIALLTPVLRDEHQAGLSRADYEKAFEQTRAMAALAREAALVFTQDGHRKGSVRRAVEIGFLGQNVLLSHAIDLDEEEIRICADTGASIAHNPSAVASIMGRCPVPELLDAGVVVALGSDATAPDRSADMFRHIQQCMHYHRTAKRDPGVLPPGKVLEMATCDAARALGMDGEIGALERGKKADLIVVDMNRPHLKPFNMQAFRVAYFANGNDVETVIIDGEVVYRDRRAVRVDETAILAQADREAELMVERIGARAMLGQPDGFFGVSRYPRQGKART